MGKFQEDLRLRESVSLMPVKGLRMFKMCYVLNSKKESKMTAMIRAFACTAFLLLMAAPVLAQEIKAGDLVISQPWTRATPGGAKVAGGYLTIENKGPVADRLLGGSTDVAGKVEVHEMSMSNGVMVMRPVDGGLTIAPGKTVKLAPGGYHLMLTDLKNPLKQGETVAVTLAFEKAGQVKLTLAVQGVGAQGPDDAKGSGSAAPDHMNMKGMSGHPGMKM
jgi:copper(I)-binding protein